MLRIGLVGSGLGGSILAGRLAAFADVTVFERGGERWTLPAGCRWSGRQPGMSATFVHGRGGTTNLWHGGLMRPARRELGAHWPELVRREVSELFREAVVDLYGFIGLEMFDAEQLTAANGRQWADVLVKPKTPFRANRSFDRPGVRLKLDCPVIAVEPRRRGVEIIWLEKGVKERFIFDIVVLCAGAFGSAELLLRSGLGGAAAGANLHDHPMGFVAKLRPSAEALAKIRAERFHLSRRSEVAYKVADPETELVSAFYLRPAADGPLRSDPYLTLRACSLQGGGCGCCR